MKSIYKIACFAAILGAFVFQACETTELDLRTNPNALSADQSSPDFLLSNIQLDFASTVESFGAVGAELTRIDYMFGRTYRDAFAPSEFDSEWRRAFTEIRTDIKAMTPLAQDAGLTYHLGMAQFIEAFTITMLVDFYGDIPYSEANLGSENFNPSLDTGESIYAAAFDLLDQAIVNFNATSAALPQNDFFYDGDATKWVQAVNSLKMKLYMQTRLVDSGALASFDAIVASGNYITDPADDMQFKWGTNEVQPDTRHPRYNSVDPDTQGAAGSYSSTGGNEYMSDDQMNYMIETNDPRIRYYFYRQNELTPGAEAPPALETLQCSLQNPPAHYAGFPFCSLPNGYWGRDHGNNEGTPPDGFLRTLTGVYPAGGKFDDSSFEGQVNGAGGAGAGITPIMLASTSDFYIAEAALVEGQAATARTALLAGLAKSVAKVVAFGAVDSGTDQSLAPTDGDITTHSTSIGSAFDSDSEGGWNVLGREFFTSLYGNGIDAYNFYRRTGYPTNLQPEIEPNPGAFARSVFYPANFVNNNSAVQQKAEVNVQVFWDTNPASPGFPSSN